MVVVGESCGGGGIEMSVVMGLVVSMSDKSGPENETERKIFRPLNEFFFILNFMQNLDPKWRLKSPHFPYPT